MAEGELDIKFYGDAANVIKEQAKLIKQQNDAIEGYKKLGTESKKAGKESEKAAKDAERANAIAAKELEKFARHTKEINRTPLEKYSDQMLRLNQALKAGRIDQESFNRAVAGAKKEFDGTKGSMDGAFGAGMKGKIGVIGMAIAALAPAVEVFTTAITEHMKKVDEAGEKLKSDATGLTELQQLTDDPRELKTMIAGAKSIYASGATSSLADAGKLEYSINSAGMARYREQIAELQASGVVLDMEAMLKGSAALEASMGLKETGGFEKLVSKAFGAGVDAPARAETLLLTASKVAAPAKKLKLSDEDVLAAVATVSKELGTAEEAGTTLKALFSGIAKKKLPQQKDLKSYVSYLASQEAAGQDVRDLIGDSQEAVTAFSSLRDSSTRYDANRKAITTAESNDVYASKVNLYKASPTLIAAREAKRSAASLVLSQMDAAEKETMADALQDDLNAQMYASGVGPVRHFIKNAAMEGRRGRLGKGASWLMGGSNEGFLESFGQLGSEDIRVGLSDFNSSLRGSGGKADEKHLDAASQLNAAAQNMRQVSEMMLQATPDYTNVARQRAAAATPVE